MSRRTISHRILPLLLVAAVAPAALSQAFYGLPLTPTYHGVTEIVVGDFDGDELPDVVAHVVTPSTLNFLSGRGDGTLRLPVVAYTPASVAEHMLAADLDGDGALDLLVNQGSKSVSIFGHDDGTLTAGAQFPVGNLLHAADTNGDGLIDAICAVDGSLLVKVMVGHGDGSFDVPPGVAANNTPYRFDVADFEADGRSDAVSLGAWNGPVDYTILRGQADGSLLETGVLPAALGNGPTFVLAGDVNADGHADIVGDISSKLDVRLGQGDGLTFTQLPVSALAGSVADVELVDLDLDGTLDLAWCWQGLHVRDGLGDGSFAPAVLLDHVPGATEMAVADMDLDGRPDLVFGSGMGVNCLLNHDDGFHGLASWSLGSQGKDAECGDVDEDGDADVVLVTSGPAVMPGLGNGGLGPAQFPSSASANPTALQLVDHDADGHLDLVGCSNTSVVVRHGLGNGNFGPSTASLVTGSLDGFVLADLDLDGTLDMAAASGPDQKVYVLHGGPSGAFTSITQLTTSGSDAEIACADLDGNGFLDLMTSDSWTNLSRFLATGPAQFAPGVTLITPNHQSHLLEELTGDGVPDLVTMDLGPGGVWGVHLQPGVGDGSFLAGSHQLAGSAGLRLRRTLDADGDGHLDLLLSYGFGNLFDVMLVRAGGQLVNAGLSFCGAHAGDIVATGDLDGDGRPDVVAPYSDAPGPVRTYLNAAPTLGAWSNLGYQLAGTAGVPHLVGTGSLAAGSSGSLSLEHTAPSAAGLLFVSLGATPAPFKGGHIVAFPPAVMLPVGTTGAGGLTLAWGAWPAGLSGASVAFQVAVQDAAAVHGVALSNGVQGHVP